MNVNTFNNTNLMHQLMIYFIKQVESVSGSKECLIKATFSSSSFLFLYFLRLSDQFAFRQVFDDINNTT